MFRIRMNYIPESAGRINLDNLKKILKRILQKMLLNTGNLKLIGSKKEKKEPMNSPGKDR